jgi:SAM-dependent methyltransferase
MIRTYFPGVYNVRDQRQARAVILTPQSGQTTDERWERETPYLSRLIFQQVPSQGLDTRVLDYGCGIGRMSKAMIEAYDAHVLGVDISYTMRALAVDYVKDNRFATCSPEYLNLVNLDGGAFDIALAVWVLQHCLNPEDDIKQIALALQKRDGCLFVVNERRRVVPVEAEPMMMWEDDGIDIRNLLHEISHQIVREGMMDPFVVGEEVSRNTFWGIYRF